MSVCQLLLKASLYEEDVGVDEFYNFVENTKAPN